ncbi:hypothetical protein GW17_00009874 [Ensete ventricosum]|nr:hypothetical protein GW17_00009874 [Ensete ventricosum]
MSRNQQSTKLRSWYEINLSNAFLCRIRDFSEHALIKVLVRERERDHTVGGENVDFTHHVKRVILNPRLTELVDDLIVSPTCRSCSLPLVRCSAPLDQLDPVSRESPRPLDRPGTRAPVPLDLGRRNPRHQRLEMSRFTASRGHLEIERGSPSMAFSSLLRSATPALGGSRDCFPSGCGTLAPASFKVPSSPFSV